MSILIDIPQIAYKTLSISCFVVGEDGKRDYEVEMEMEQSLKDSLKGYEYLEEHEHIGGYR